MIKVLAGRRILVVEDEMLVLMLIEAMLSDMGCESIVAAPSVAKALAILETQSFDVAMLDVNLGGEKSYPIAEALTARGVPFLFSTGYNQPRLAEGYTEHPILQKPISDDALAEMLGDLLEARAAAAPLV